ncbi:hypothetical protein B0A52_03740 [Exophiala mesophila]|uniref:Hemerythrin-like domain-containing protein n=1 Tax=Exophiala mesophila TaxID=212818 RepID=A0A438NAC2_EXOME|nr:hypothetical protein B0A52_03740 [Exophiala mesophila]
MTTTPATRPDRTTFSTVIDADHSTINQFAALLKRARTPEERSRLILEVAWRLVRHDFSEEMVMRPAFITHLGQEGQEMAEHDRKDHTAARKELLDLFDSGLDLNEFPTRIGDLFAELAEHMKVESGQYVPKLEQLLNGSESQRLGWEYLHTQILTPQIEYLDSNGKRTRLWKSAEDYVRSEPNRFLDIWHGYMAGNIKLIAESSGVRVPPRL